MTVERSPGGRLTNRAAPGASEIRQRINDHLSLWHEVAKDAAARRKKSARRKKPDCEATKPAEADEVAAVLDLELAANHVGRQIARVQVHLTEIERTFAAKRAPSLAAVHSLLEAALLLGFRAYQLTFVDFEPAITGAEERLAILAKNREAASAKAEQGHRSLKRRADVIRKAHPDWKDSAVTRKMIKDEPALENEREPDTIRRIIKHPNKQKRRSSK
jgi:hypothetical protein